MARKSKEEKFKKFVVNWIIGEIIQEVVIAVFKYFRAREQKRAGHHKTFLQAKTRKAAEEYLQWANREGKYADPTVAFSKSEKSPPSPPVTPDRLLKTLSRDEYLQWANREGKYADPDVEPQK